MECTSPLDSLACLGATVGIILPLVVVSWLVGLLLAAFVLEGDRRALARVGTITLPLGLVSVLVIAIIFAEANSTGLWELLVGPAVVFGECVGIARVFSLRRKMSGPES